jgi:integrase
LHGKLNRLEKTLTDICNIRFQDIRHTYAGILLSIEECPVYVKERLGHSTIEVTVDIYGKLIPGSNRDAVNRLDELPSVPYTHPGKKEEPHLTEDTALLPHMVPNTGFIHSINL